MIGFIVHPNKIKTLLILGINIPNPNAEKQTNNVVQTWIVLLSLPNFPGLLIIKKYKIEY